MLWYLAWRVTHGLHQTISLNFLITGHTIFAPDWCFGLVKQRFRKVRVCSLDELSDVVRTSTATGVNISQLVMSSNGDMNVIQCDWEKLQEYFKPLTGIKSYQHFRFSAQSPGVVFCKQYINTPDELEVQFNMLKSKNMPPFEEPAVIPPPGLSAKRQWYLYDSIRDFCTDESMDITGPRPSLPTPDADDFGDDHAPQAAAVAQNQKNRGCGTRGRGNKKIRLSVLND